MQATPRDNSEPNFYRSEVGLEFRRGNRKNKLELGASLGASSGTRFRMIN